MKVVVNSGGILGITSSITPTAPDPPWTRTVDPDGAWASLNMSAAVLPASRRFAASGTCSSSRLTSLRSSRVPNIGSY